MIIGYIYIKYEPLKLHILPYSLYSSPSQKMLTTNPRGENSLSSYCTIHSLLAVKVSYIEI